MCGGGRWWVGYFVCELEVGNHTSICIFLYVWRNGISLVGTNGIKTRKSWKVSGVNISRTTSLVHDHHH